MPDDFNTEFAGDINTDVRRLEVNKAGCTTNQVGGTAIPGQTAMSWAAFEGNSSNYTIPPGAQARGSFAPAQWRVLISTVLSLGRQRSLAAPRFHASNRYSVFLHDGRSPNCSLNAVSSE